MRIGSVHAGVTVNEESAKAVSDAAVDCASPVTLSQSRTASSAAVRSSDFTQHFLLVYPSLTAPMSDLCCVKNSTFGCGVSMWRLRPIKYPDWA
jgi:hypothetical protein